MAQYARKLSKGLRWYFKFDYQGKTYFSKAIYLTKQEAKKAEANMYKSLSDNILQIKVNGISVDRAINERLSYLQVKSSDKYYVDSKRYLDKFKEHFNSRKFSEINRKDISDYIMTLAEEFSIKGKKNFSVNAAIRCYKSFFNFIIDQHEFDLKNPFIKFKFFPIDKHLKYIPADEEIEALLNICDQEQALLIRFIIETGARINEALNFTYGDIENDYIVLYTRKSKDSNKTPRKIPLPWCLKDLNSVDIKRIDYKVFGVRVFNAWKERPKFLERKLKSLGLPVWGWHNLRHRYASKLSKEGRPIFEIMNLLGHQSIETTQIYLQMLQ